MKKNGKKLLKLIPLLLGGAVGALLGFGIASGLDQALGDASPLLMLGAYAALLLGVYVIYMLHVILHEAGHLLCGLMTGYRFCSFRVMSLMWQKNRGGRIRFSRMTLAGTGGQCLMIPPEWTDNGFPFLLYNLSGALMNLLLGFFCALCAHWLRAWPIPHLLLNISAVFGLGFALLNGLPMPGLTASNDGSNILALRRSAAARRALWVQMKINEQLSLGLRLKDMPDEWFAAPPEEEMDHPLVCALAVFAVNRQMDQLRLAEAEAGIHALFRRKKGLLPVYRSLLTLEGACCELLLSHPGKLTEELASPAVQQVMKAMKTYPTVLRTRCITALLQDRDEEKFTRAMEEFDRRSSAHPNPQEIDSERELIALAQEVFHA